MRRTLSRCGGKTPRCLPPGAAGTAGRGAGRARGRTSLPRPVQQGKPEEGPEVVLLLAAEPPVSARHVLPRQLPLLDGAAPAEIDAADLLRLAGELRAISRRVHVRGARPEDRKS